MSEHQEREEELNPLATPMAVVDYADQAQEAIREGGLSARGWSELGHEMSGGLREVLAGEASAGETALTGTSVGVLGPLGIAGGIMEMVEGYRKGGAEAGIGMTSGGAGVIAGASGLLSLAGVSGAAPLGPAGATLSTAMKATHYGDENVRKMGWLHNTDGESESASEWAGETGRSVRDGLSERGWSHLGTSLGAITTGAMCVPAAAVALGGAAIGGYSALNGAGHHLGSWAAHNHRENVYNNWDSKIANGGAAALADYDDDREAAVERSKREHPERWGMNPANPTYGQKFQQIMADMNRSASKKP